MNRKVQKRAQISVNNIMYWAVGTLFIFTMLSVWLVSGLFAKYIVTDSAIDSARTASSGVEIFELLENKAEETYTNSGVYELKEDEVKKNEYKKVLPGVDIPKNPFVRLKLNDAEVDYELYIQVVESDSFPEYVTYTIDEEFWEPYNKEKGIYKCKTYFDASTQYDDDLPIIMNDLLYVSEHYVGNSETFSLSFNAWLVQVD